MARLTLLLTVMTAIIAVLGGFRLLMGTIREMQWRKRCMGSWSWVMAGCVMKTVTKES